MKLQEYEEFRKESLVIKNSHSYFNIGIDEYFYIFLVFMIWTIFNMLVFIFVFSSAVFYYYGKTFLEILILNIPNLFTFFFLVLWINLLRKNTLIIYENFKKNNSRFICDVEREFNLWIAQKNSFEKLQQLKKAADFSANLEKLKRFLFKTDRERIRKEILEKRLSNIYVLINFDGDIFYVGQALYPKWRLDSHKRHFGKEISMKIIEERIPLDKVNEREKYWISFYGGIKNLKNQTKGGSGILELLIEKELSKIWDNRNWNNNGKYD